jgi:sugar transferase EpsL
MLLVDKAIKRVLDVIISVAGLILFSPVLCTIGLVVLVLHGPPVIFKQKRPGLHGKPFTIYKFRTMKDLYDSNNNMLPDADRLTKFGRWLRATSLDELPELINVLKGDMSLVGPRPLLLEYIDRYTPEQARRHDVKPGVTGWAQVNGRNDLTWEEKFKLDVWYVDNRNFWLDLYIIIVTVWKVFRREGISAEGYATMPKFVGSNKSQYLSNKRTPLSRVH